MLLLASDHHTQTRRESDTTRMLRSAAGSFACDKRFRRARGWVRARLNRTQHAPALDVIVVAMYEAASNAVEHTASGQPAGSFTITMYWDDATFRLAVSEQGGTTFPTRDGSEAGEAPDDLPAAAWKTTPTGFLATPSTLATTWIRTTAPARAEDRRSDQTTIPAEVPKTILAADLHDDDGQPGAAREAPSETENAEAVSGLPGQSHSGPAAV